VISNYISFYYTLFTHQKEKKQKKYIRATKNPQTKSTTDNNLRCAPQKGVLGLKN